MDKTKNIVGKPLAWLLTLIYFASYVTRINFAAIIQEVVSDTGFEKSALSVILVCLSVSYAVGQVVNGYLGDKIKPQNLIMCGLCVATAVNLLFPFFSSSIGVMSVLWTVNGFAQAMMWPPMVKILVANCDEATYGYSVVRVSWGSSFGTILIYLLSPIIIKLVGWRAVFYTSALIGLCAAALWAVFMPRINSESRSLSESEKPSKGFKLPKTALFPLIFIALAIILQGMLRDGVTSWMPSYLAENFGTDNASSIFQTVTLAIFSIVMFSFAGWLYEKFFKNEVALAALIFAVATASALALFLLFGAGSVVAILMMMLISGCMHGINLMLITHVPKRFKKHGNISTISGIINSCTYIGSAIFTYGVALLAERIGWQYTVGVWAIIALLGTLCCLIAMSPWKKFASPEEGEK